MNAFKLKTEIERRGIRFTHVSKQTSICYSSLMNYFAGRTPMPDAMAKLICLTCGIPLESILDEAPAHEMRHLV